LSRFIFPSASPFRQFKAQMAQHSDDLMVKAGPSASSTQLPGHLQFGPAFDPC
jgi:hypothetical protein